MHWFISGTHNGYIVCFDATTYKQVTHTFWKTDISTVTCSLIHDHVVVTSGESAMLFKIR